MTSSYYLKDKKIRGYLVRFTKSGFGVMAEVFDKYGKEIFNKDSWCKSHVISLVRIEMKKRGL